MSDTEPVKFLTAQMRNSETQWSLGTFGALAEFMRDADEPFDFEYGKNSLTLTTARGGIRLASSTGLRLVAFETTTRESWAHRVALCLPRKSCSMSQRSVLTELGPDKNALRAQDRDAILFDLGIGALQADLCVRVADPAMAAQLRACTGRAVLAADNPAMGHIVKASPHRVFMTQLGRIEVYQPIPDPNGKSPEGPHTHVLPKLLSHRRTHSATEPIPEGWVPCAHLYPPHPLRDMLGRDRPFDVTRHDAFQSILQAYGNPEFITLKNRVADAVATGKAPSAINVPRQRFARTNVRVALRQLKALGAECPSLSAWIAAHERVVENDDDDDERHRHHR